MSGLLAGIAGGIAGGADAYGNVMSNRKAEKLEAAKAAALEKRQKNLEIHKQTLRHEDQEREWKHEQSTADRDYEREQKSAALKHERSQEGVYINMDTGEERYFASGDPVPEGWKSEKAIKAAQGEITANASMVKAKKTGDNSDKPATSTAMIRVDKQTKEILGIKKDDTFYVGQFNSSDLPNDAQLQAINELRESENMPPVMVEKAVKKNKYWWDKKGWRLMPVGQDAAQAGAPAKNPPVQTGGLLDDPVKQQTNTPSATAPSNAPAPPPAQQNIPGGSTVKNRRPLEEILGGTVKKPGANFQRPYTGN
jgi:hypothetical protein